MPPVSAEYSIILRVEIDHQPGMLGLVATAIGAAGGSIGSVDLVGIEHGHTLREITIETAGEEHAARIGEAVNEVEGVINIAPGFGGINLEDISPRAASRSRNGRGPRSTSRSSTTTSTAPRPSRSPP